MLDSVELSLSSLESESEDESSDELDPEEFESEELDPEEELPLLEGHDDASDREQEQDLEEDSSLLLDDDENEGQLHEDEEEDDDEEDEKLPKRQDLLSRALLTSSGLKNPSPISAAHATPMTAHKSKAVLIFW